MSSTPIRAEWSLPYEGRSFGGYRLARPIATGGMATVFLGRKTGPGRYAQTAAIKVIHPHLARTRELAEMFMDEARLAACVNHPSVCRVLDFGEAEGTYFLAMEYVRGESWATVLEALFRDQTSRGRVAVLAAHVLSQACEGLHAIHEAVGADGRPMNIVHRDVSPQNLLVAYDGNVRLLDFGIASAEGRAHTGSTEVVRGRYAYMAPEQMRGLDVDRRADVWSVGVMLLEALSGQNPFIRDTQIATMLAVTEESLPGFPAGMPEGLRHVLERSLARTPEQRFASARELGDALTQYLGAEGETALGTELSRHMRRLFAEQIAHKRAALRELSGEDSSMDTAASRYPSIEPQASAPEKLKPARRKRRRTSRAAFVILGLALFAASSAISWHFAQISSGPAPTRSRASAGGAPAGRPAHVERAPSSRQSTEAEPPQASAGSAPALGAARAAEPASGADDMPPQRSQHRRRAREEAAEDADEAKAPEQSERGGPGTVVVGTSQGWALVFEGARPLGTTPLKVELPSGRHTLTVKPYGEGSPRRISVDVRESETTKLRIDL